MFKKIKLRKSAKILFIIFSLLVAIRLAMAPVILHFANKRLAEMKGYYGHIDDIDLAIIRGAYSMDSIYINKVDTVSGKQTPFFAAGEIDLSVEWKALFKGSIVGELIFERPMLRFTKDRVEPKDVTKDSTDFRRLLKDFMPLKINRVEIIQGNVQYQDFTSQPKVDVHLTSLRVIALNLRNSYDSSVLLPASITASSTLYEGTLLVNVKLNPLATEPTFDMNAELRDTNLVLLNDFFQAYGKIDVNKGNFGLFAEVAAREGAFKGYVKPLIKDLDIVGHEDRNDNVLRKMWEGVAGAVAEIFENQPKNQAATKIPFSGSLKNPSINLFETIISVLQNAFINALQPAIDHQININSVGSEEKEKKGFFKRLFGGDDNKNNSKEFDKKKSK